MEAAGSYTSTYHQNYMLSHHTNEKSVFSGLTASARWRVRRCQNATCQITMFFVCCLFSEPVIMHTTEHCQQMDLNRGNDGMTTNKQNPKANILRNHKFAPASHQSTRYMWWSRCHGGRSSSKQFSCSINVIPPMPHIHLLSLMLAITESLSNKPAQPQPHLSHKPTLNLNTKKPVPWLWTIEPGTCIFCGQG
jgi:hypothetical protein